MGKNSIPKLQPSLLPPSFPFSFDTTDLANLSRLALNLESSCLSLLNSRDYYWPAPPGPLPTHSSYMLSSFVFIVLLFDQCMRYEDWQKPFPLFYREEPQKWSLQGELWLHTDYRPCASLLRIDNSFLRWWLKHLQVYPSNILTWIALLNCHNAYDACDPNKV